MLACMTASPHSLREVRPGREFIPAGQGAPRHRHLDAYALVVVKGVVAQSNYAGRVVARAGDLLLQPTLDCHANALQSPGVEILRLPWDRMEGLGGLYRVRDLDALVRQAERDPLQAAAIVALEVAAAQRQRPADDWPDLLAGDLAADCTERLRDWSDRHGLRPETVSRGFAVAYGVTPARFRRELRTREAWLRITGSGERLSSIASETGFADQAHMTRAVSAMTGAGPRVWRARTS